MSLFTKKPVTIEARQFTDNTDRSDEGQLTQLVAWIGTDKAHNDGTHLFIKTLEGIHRATLGDWIIKGVKGEFYPCKPDIFAATYVAAEPDPTGPLCDATTGLPTETWVQNVKALRRDLDEIVQRMRFGICSEETMQARIRVLEGIMWLGMELKRVGSIRPDLVGNPYPDSKNPTNAVINPTADKLKL